MTSSPASTMLHPRERWLATGSLLLGMVAFTIAIMVANVILPQLMTSLRVDLDQVQWVLTGHGIAQTVVMPMVGWLTGLLGHRALYLGSLALFCGGSVLSGLAWSIGSLVFFQVVSGIGVGLMQPLMAAIMYQIFPPNQRGLALGLSMVGWSFGPAIGPILGGYLVEAFHWRAAFYVSVPLGVVGLISAFVYLPALPRPTRKAMDQLGLITMSVALITLLMATTQGRREGWDSSYITTLLSIGTVSTLLFLLIEWRSAAPLVDLRLFRSLPFTMASLVVFISSVAFRGTGVLTIVFMQQVLELTPLDVGWLLLTGNIAYGVAVVVAGRFADKMNLSVLTMSGLLMFAGAFFWFATVNETVGMLAIIVLLTLRLTSFGLVGPPNNLSAMRALPEDQVVMASGVFALIRSIAGTGGAAVAVTIYEQRYFFHVQRYIENNDVMAPGLQDAMGAVQQFLQRAGELPAFLAVQTPALVYQRLLAEANTLAYQDYFLLSACISLAGIVPTVPWQEVGYALRRFLQGRPTPATVPTAAGVRSDEDTGSPPATAPAATQARS